MSSIYRRTRSDRLLVCVMLAADEEPLISDLSLVDFTHTPPSSSSLQAKVLAFPESGQRSCTGWTVEICIIAWVNRIVTPRPHCFPSPATGHNGCRHSRLIRLFFSPLPRRHWNTTNQVLPYNHPSGHRSMGAPAG